MDSLSRKWVLDRLVYLKCIWQVICRMKNFVNVFRLPMIVLIERILNQKFTTDQLTTKHCLKLSILYVVIDVYSFKFLWTKLCNLSRKMSVLKQLFWFDLIWFDQQQNMIITKGKLNGGAQRCQYHYVYLNNRYR